jgi:hypothetical protein
MSSTYQIYNAAEAPKFRTGNHYADIDNKILRSLSRLYVVNFKILWIQTSRDIFNGLVNRNHLVLRLDGYHCICASSLWYCDTNIRCQFVIFRKSSIQIFPVNTC